MRPVRYPAALVACLALGWPLAVPGEDSLKSIERKIAKQPELREPLYALVVLGPQQESRLWLIVDKSSPDVANHDVLYIDLNGDGDLTAAKERITRPDVKGASRFTLPELVEPKTGVKHTDFSVRLSGGEKPTYMLSLKWRGEHALGGGYPVDPSHGYMSFGKSPQEAPVVWFNGDGPFQFQPWYNEPLVIGQETDLKLFLGQFGAGENTFCAFREHVLPQDEAVLATVIYTGQDGQQREAASFLDRRC